MSLTLALGVDPESRALAFVANALGLAGTPALRVVAASDPALPAVDLGREGSALAAKPENAAKYTGAVVHTLQDSSGASYSAFGTIVLGLVGASNDAAAAGGANPAEQARVTSWLSFAELHAKDASALEAVDMYLVDRSFLATSGVSVADLVIFHVLYAAVASMAEKKKRQLSNLTRWFDQIQHEACVLAGEHAPALLTFPRAAVAFPSASKDAKAKASGAAAPKKAKAKAAAAGGAGGAGGAAGKPSVKGADSEAAKKAAAKKAEKEAKKAKRKAQKGAAGPTKPAGIGVHMCQFLVGEVTMAQNHPDPDKTKLLHEEINCGETEIRTLVSGLVGHYEPADLVGRKVIVLANLKPKPFGSIKSHGMVVCASNADHSVVELLKVPDGAKVGERVMFEGFDGEFAGPGPMTKKKVFEKVQPDLTSGDDLVVTYKGGRMMTSAGPVTAASLKAAVIG